MTDKQREESAAFHFKKVQRIYEDYRAALADLGEVLDMTVPPEVDFDTVTTLRELKDLLMEDVY